MKEDQNLEIVPGERIGPYYLKWDLETLKRHLPAHYVVSDDEFTWYVEFEDYLFGIRKEDKEIDFITVQGKFRQHFKHKINSESTLKQIEEDFGPTKLFIETFIIPTYPGMELYFEDENKDDLDDDSWKKIKIIRVVVRDPNFIRGEYSLADYKRMKQTKYECPFPKDKLIKNPEEDGTQNQ